MSIPDDVSPKAEPTGESSIFSWKGFGKQLMQVGKTALTTAESIKALEKENERLQILLKELTKEVVNLQISVAETKARTDARFENINERIDLKLENVSNKILNGAALVDWNGNGNTSKARLLSPDMEPVSSLSNSKSRS
jgi:hypothetical protein